MNTKSEIVSYDEEPLILVDSSDREVGYLDKARCHDGQGRLHRAFSLFLFNDQDEVLIQKRARRKRLWPGHWSNSCCSHPRRGETMDSAVRRRVQQELGLDAEALHDLRFVYKFEYVARFGDEGAEHELCSVYLAWTSGAPTINSTEIADWGWVSGDELSRLLAERPDDYTPWLRLEWAELCEHHAEDLPIGRRPETCHANARPLERTPTSRY